MDGLQFTVFAVMLVLGVKAHLTMQEKNWKVVALLVYYLAVFFFLFIFIFIDKLISMIFLILVMTSSSQLFQVYLYMESCKVYIPERTLLRNRIILVIFAFPYLAMFPIAFMNNVGAYCGPE